MMTPNEVWREMSLEQRKILLMESIDEWIRDNGLGDNVEWALEGLEPLTLIILKATLNEMAHYQGDDYALDNPRDRAATGTSTGTLNRR